MIACYPALNDDEINIAVDKHAMVFSAMDWHADGNLS